MSHNLALALDPVALPFSLISVALAKLIEREAGTFLVSVPALQGRGLFLGCEGCEAVKADFSFPCYLARGWPNRVSLTLCAYTPFGLLLLPIQPLARLRLDETTSLLGKVSRTQIQQLFN